MKSNKAFAQQLANTGFLEDLLGIMIDRGFGVLPARDMAIEALRLLLKHHPVWCENPPSAYELTRFLGTSPRKIRGYLDEISFRNPDLDELALNAALKEILLSGERVRDGSYVAIEIDDGLVREHARQLVRENFGIAEQGNANTIIKLSGKHYATLCLAIFPKHEVQSVLNAFDKEWPQGAVEVKASKSLASCMVERFMTAASDQAGKKASEAAGAQQLAAAAGGGESRHFFVQRHHRRKHRLRHSWGNAGPDSGGLPGGPSGGFH